MMWQGYFDESVKGDWFVIAGYFARVDQWAAFAEEWAKMTRKYGRIDRAGNWHIHMSEHNRNDESLSAFRRTINDYALSGVAVAVRPTDFKKAVSRLIGFRSGHFIPLKGNLLRNTYLFSFEMLLDCISRTALDGLHRLNEIDLNCDSIEMIFDEGHNETVIRDAWEGFKGMRKTHELPNIFSLKPHFKDDKVFLPLQAADFLAYWVRERVNAVNRPSDIEGRPIFPFGNDEDKRVPIKVFVLDEEQLIARWESAINSDGSKIFDARKLITCKLGSSPTDAWSADDRD